MITRRQIVSCIDDSEKSFLVCWKFLCDLKEQKGISSERLYSFQYGLAMSLFHLSRMRDKIIGEKRYLVGRKKNLSFNWFVRRMKSLDGYIENIDYCIHIGKGIGDSFAWIFYMREREYIPFHLKHNSIDHISSGLGGIAEIEFIKKFGDIVNEFAIYHGNTTFLRLGDVSFFDRNTGRLSSLGEIKSRPIDDETIGIEIYFAERFSTIDRDNLDTRKEYKTGLSESAKQRLHRQMTEMEKSFVQIPQEDMPVYGNEDYTNEIDSLYNSIVNNKSVYKKFDDGLMVVGYKPRKNYSLSSVLLDNSDDSFKKQLGDLPKWALDIVDHSTNENSLHVGKIDLTMMMGTAPIFWRTLPTELLESIYFTRYMYITLYNPLFFVRKLKESGLIVEVSEKGNPTKVTLERGEKKVYLYNMDLFLLLIYRYLTKENSVVNMIKTILEEMIKGDAPPNTPIPIHIMMDYVEMKPEENHV